MKIAIPEQILAKVKNLDERSRYLLLGGVVVLVFLLDFFVLMRPQFAALSKIHPKIKTVSDNIHRAQNDISNMPGYALQAAQLKEKLEDAGQSVYSKEEIFLILERISLLANQHNVKINSIMPDLQQQEPLVEETDRTYYAVPIVIEAASGYHDFGRFLNAVEQDETALDVDNFSINSSSDTARHALKLTFKALVFENKKGETEQP